MDNYYSQIKKDNLCDSRGVKYYDFIKGLTPRYHIVWLHLLCGHLAMVLVSVAAILVATKAPRLTPIVVLAASFLLGYAVAYIMLFMHEASHYNLAGDRRINDVLANIFVGSLLGRNIKSYRTHHWGHHKYHGQTNDTEHAYFDPLNISFFVELLTGMKPLTAYMAYKARLKAKALSAEPEQSVWESRFMLAVGIGINSAVLFWSFQHGYMFFILTWLLALMVFFPFFAVLRPILEHRDQESSQEVDYFKVPHGIVNRMFGDGPVTSTLGGAGFNRHLLHHIEPKISYTRLKEFEKFLFDTPFKDEIKKHQTTYWETFVKLFESSW